VWVHIHTLVQSLADVPDVGYLHHEIVAELPLNAEREFMDARLN
jgi:hypothetical protein